MHTMATTLPLPTPTTNLAAATVAPVERDDEELVLAALTAAFANDPPARWLYPAAEDYQRHFPQFARAFGGGAFGLGTACQTADHAACALWFSPGSGPDDELLIRSIETSIAPERHREVFAVLEAMGEVHPLEPHWYLALIGVDPAHQGFGLGSALLRQTLQRCDRERRPAYLEATNRRNVALYERHGFRRLAALRVSGCPPIVPMWREPRLEGETFDADHQG